MYGNPEVTPGGRALKFYSSVRIEVKKTEILKEKGGESYGNRVCAKVVKNKVAPPFRTAEFDIIYGKGISKMGEIADAAVTLEIIDKSGSWYSYGEKRLCQGREKLIALLTDKKELCNEIEEKVRANMSKLDDEPDFSVLDEIEDLSGIDDDTDADEFDDIQFELTPEAKEFLESGGEL